MRSKKQITLYLIIMLCFFTPIYDDIEIRYVTIPPRTMQVTTIINGETVLNRTMTTQHSINITIITTTPHKINLYETKPCQYYLR